MLSIVIERAIINWALLDFIDAPLNHLRQMDMSSGIPIYLPVGFSLDSHMKLCQNSIFLFGLSYLF